MPLFRLDDLTLQFPASPEPTLDGVSLSIPGGGVVALLGSSGSGKSTLLNVLGLLWGRNPTAGTVLYERGKTRWNYSDPACTPQVQDELRAREFGFALQSSYLLPHFTAMQNLAVPLELRGDARAERTRRVEALLARAGLLHKAADKARTLSGGERQRIAVLRAIVHDPFVVFADEPISNLDPHNARLVLDLLADWRAGEGEPAREGERTLVLVVHDPEIAWERADAFIVLRQGRVVRANDRHSGVWTRDEAGGPRQLTKWIVDGSAESTEGAAARST